MINPFIEINCYEPSTLTEIKALINIYSISLVRKDLNSGKAIISLPNPGQTILSVDKYEDVIELINDAT